MEGIDIQSNGIEQSSEIGSQICSQWMVKNCAGETRNSTVKIGYPYAQKLNLNHSHILKNQLKMGDKSKCKT